MDVFDFKVVNSIENQQHLTFIQGRGEDNQVDWHGTAHIMNSAYEMRTNITIQDDRDGFNMHEFNVLDNGRTAMVTAERSIWMNMSDIGVAGNGWIRAGGFEEIDINTGATLFDWRSDGSVSLNESTFGVPTFGPNDRPGWDYFHVNAADKNADGNYVLSSRFTNTVFFISGQDGSIIWRLGGLFSDFELVNFRMYRQHHVRFVDQGENYITVSFLNNASDEGSQDERTSSALFVKLDLVHMTATAIQRYSRPSGGLSRLRGSVQVLPSGNVFVGWSESGYQSEFTPDGECVMEARFRSDRYSSYRSYKYEFSALPSQPPDLSVTTHRSQTGHASTIFYVSWNGATHIARWNFYAQASQYSEPVLIGSVPKTGFETAFSSDGYMDWVSVEAVHVNETALGRSPVRNTELGPDFLTFASSPPSGSPPQPDDPAVIVAGATLTSTGPAGELIDPLIDPANNPNMGMDMGLGVDLGMGSGAPGNQSGGSGTKDQGDEEDNDNNTKIPSYAIPVGVGIFAIATMICTSVVAVWFCYRRRQREYESVPLEDQEEKGGLGEEQFTGRDPDENQNVKDEALQGLLEGSSAGSSER
jgi:hypothetical protein